VDEQSWDYHNKYAAHFPIALRRFGLAFSEMQWLQRI
jgi:hypothetical protein